MVRRCSWNRLPLASEFSCSIVPIALTRPVAFFHPCMQSIQFFRFWLSCLFGGRHLAYLESGISSQRLLIHLHSSCSLPCDCNCHALFESVFLKFLNILVCFDSLHTLLAPCPEVLSLSWSALASSARMK